MKSLAHVFLAWLLLLALPFQGVAAAGMLPCAPPAAVHAVDVHVVDVHAVAAPLAGHGHAVAMAGADNADAHCAMQATSKAASDAASYGAPDCHDGNAHHGKGSCASCCVGAAMAPATLPTPLALATPDSSSIPFHAGHVPSVDPTLLERPPRARRA